MATIQEPAAVGVFDDLEKAERTIDQLRQAGFKADEIGIIGHVGNDETVPTPAEMHSPEDNAMTAVLRGGTWGAIVGMLVILVIPGLGAVSGLGPWFEIIGAAALGAAGGGVLFAFGSLVFLRARARLYSRELEKGRFIITVKNSARKEEAVSVLQRQGIYVDKNE